MNPSFLARVVDVRRWLQADAATPLDERFARERAIARSLSACDPAERVMGWWAALTVDPDGLIGERVVALARVARVLLSLLGAVMGAGVASVAFAYDGAHPVNLLVLLGVLVGVPLALLLVTLLALLLPGQIPGASSVREAFSAINPGRWVGAWLDRYSGLAMHSGFSGAGGAFGRWQLLVFTQWFAIGYFGGVLLVGWLLVALTDLAFGWSSTLNLEAGSVYGFVSLLAWPWHGWLPAASPDLSLIEASRYNRLDTTALSMAEATRLGQWWPFVLMTIVVYGLLPRVALLAVGGMRLKAATRELLLKDAEVVALLDRLNAPTLSFDNDSEAAPAGEDGVAPAPGQEASAGRIGLVIWNDALTVDAARDWLARSFGASAVAEVRLGARQNGDERAALLAALPELDRLVVFTKGWEPPLLEFADFLGELRAVLPASASITVVPIDTDRRAVAAVDRDIWARALARHDDPRLYVMQAAAGADS